MLSHYEQISHSSGHICLRSFNCISYLHEKLTCVLKNRITEKNSHVVTHYNNLFKYIEIHVYTLKQQKSSCQYMLTINYYYREAHLKVTISTANKYIFTTKNYPFLCTSYIDYTVLAA